MHAGAIGEFLAGAFENFFQFLLSAGEFLLMKESQSFVVNFELRLDARVDQLDAATLRWRRRP
jgi:hypothetical protein